MQKIAGWGPTEPHLLETFGMLWSMEENEGKDKEPETFAELLRYRSVNFTQARETIEYVDAPPSPITHSRKATWSLRVETRWPHLRGNHCTSQYR